MIEPAHHVPDAMLAAYGAGTLPYPFAVVVATHVSLCDECRARLEAHRVLGGLVLDGLAPAAVSSDSRRRVLGALSDTATIEPRRYEEAAHPYPAPLPELFDAGGPRWRALGFGAKQAILWIGREGSLRLLSIPAGQAVAEHGHRGMELTLVLSGAFEDDSGVFRTGDLEVADQELDHTPRATEAEACVCLAATDAPLRFHALIPRLLRPILRF